MEYASKKVQSVITVIVGIPIHSSALKATKFSSHFSLSLRTSDKYYEITHLRNYILHENATVTF